MKRTKDKGVSDNGKLVEYVIPLLPYEKDLIQQVRNFLDSREISTSALGEQCPAAHAFESWRWYQAFSQWLSAELDLEEIEAEYGGDRALAYDRCLQALANSDLEDKNLYRVNSTRSSNATFIEELGDKPCDNIIFTWLESDVSSWEVVSKIVNAFGQPWKHPEELNEKSSNFEIWELIRIFFLHTQSPANAYLIGQHLIPHPVFETFYKVSSSNRLSKHSNSEAGSQSGQKFESLVIQKHNTSEAFLRADLLQLGDGPPYVGDQIKSLLRLAAQQQRFQDPRSYLRFIPWNTLELISQDELKDLGVDLNLLLKYETSIDQWVLWEPPLPGYATNHHLFVEDELFAYNIGKSWPLPGHYLDKRIIFGVESLFDCGLVPEIEKFWTKWNDCAITKRSDGDVCVLQTIPGIHLRLRTSQLDHQAALKYYRSIIEAHATQRPSGESVKELLGIDNSYNPLYEDTLRLIPDSAWTICDIDWGVPLARSSRSAVYAATLRRQQSVLSTSERGDVAVVLKDVMPRTSREVTEKFMKELDATWFALGGAARSCVKFLGLARVEFDDTHRLMLVSERATEGNIMRFFEVEFRKEVQYSKRWELLGSALLGIAGGLRWIHQHNVVHRDLHPGNVFVTDRKYRLDPKIPHEYDYMLGDLGEGKKLGPSEDMQENHHASYGAVDYRAPEQFGSDFDNNDLSAAMTAEVFSFGKLVCKLLDWHTNCPPRRDSIPSEVLMSVSDSFSPDELSEELDFLVPTAVRDTISQCLSQLPGMRPRMKEVAQELEDLWCGLKEDHSDDREGGPNVEWCFWNWRKAGIANTASLPIHSENTFLTVDSYDI